MPLCLQANRMMLDVSTGRIVRATCSILASFGFEQQALFPTGLTQSLNPRLGCTRLGPSAQDQNSSGTALCSLALWSSGCHCANRCPGYKARRVCMACAFLFCALFGQTDVTPVMYHFQPRSLAILFLWWPAGPADASFLHAT